ncbi:unnamed protein product [Allacma fusca]|uniref:Uncharacterized protein n=1 Tax=Allacma fusca TaxID=39272 RepID=A0A8J2J887_9HEXA|nr:unnamed protein product [Allacma fusca]
MSYHDSWNDNKKLVRLIKSETLKDLLRRSFNKTIGKIEIAPVYQNTAYNCCAPVVGIWCQQSGCGYWRHAKETNKKCITEQVFSACFTQDISGDGTGCVNMTAIVGELPKTHLKEEQQVQAVAEPSDQTKRHSWNNPRDLKKYTVNISIKQL